MTALLANESWPIIEDTLNFFYENGGGKKMYLDEVSHTGLQAVLIAHTSAQNGWPSKTSDGVQPNSPDAVANVANEKVRFDAELNTARFSIRWAVGCIGPSDIR